MKAQRPPRLLCPQVHELHRQLTQATSMQEGKLGTMRRLLAEANSRWVHRASWSRAAHGGAAAARLAVPYMTCAACSGQLQ